MTAHPAPDALRLVPAVDILKEALNDIARATPETAQAETAKDMAEWTHCRAVVALCHPSVVAAAPAVQPAAGREKIARALDLLNEARNGGFFIGTDAGAKVEEAKDVLRDILAAIPTPAQASESGPRLRLQRYLEDPGAPYPGGLDQFHDDIAALSAPQAAPGEGEQS